VNDPQLVEKFRDPLRITDREGVKLSCFEGMLKLKGRGMAFLVCGGPSAREFPMQDLNRRGCWSMGVNNAAGWTVYRPQAFVHSDPPSKFHNGIWTDPGVMKFAPTPKLNRRRGRLRRKLGEKQFEDLQGSDGAVISTCDCPNVWGFERRSWLLPDASFFTHQGATCGNLNSGVLRTGEEKTICTMLLGIRILYHLGARTIFLVGVDFRMDPTRDLTDNYSFGEDRNMEACESNNNQYSVVNRWLCKMASSGVFERFGLNIYNCYERSGLRAFPHLPFADAVLMATNGMDAPFDLNGWYWKPPEDPEKKKQREARQAKRDAKREKKP